MRNHFRTEYIQLARRRNEPLLKGYTALTSRLLVSCVCYVHLRMGPDLSIRTIGRPCVSLGSYWLCAGIADVTPYTVTNCNTF